MSVSGFINVSQNKYRKFTMKLIVYEEYDFF